MSSARIPPIQCLLTFEALAREHSQDGSAKQRVWCHSAMRMRADAYV